MAAWCASPLPVDQHQKTTNAGPACHSRNNQIPAIRAVFLVGSNSLATIFQELNQFLHATCSRRVNAGLLENDPPRCFKRGRR